MLLDKLLQPLLAKCPFVLRSSKVLAEKLAGIRLPPAPAGFKYYLVTGDVTAFYPNVDLGVAKEVVMWYLTKWYPRIASSGVERNFVDLLWQAANTSLIMRWQDHLYMQKKGLAMGCAHSPTVANLYGAFFEERIIPQLGQVQFYRRYIDDCLAIVLGRSLSDALECLSPLKFPSCDIVWSADEMSQVFLDMSISLEGDGSVSFKPYRKPLNSFERIPWASHHPNDVKRGTFLGEMSRLACLSSARSAYDEALDELRSIYLGCGYPKGLVNSWVRTHAQERWNTRYDEKRAHDGVHVLKSVFNPVWDFVKVSDLSDAIMWHWIPFMREYEDSHKSRHDRRVKGQTLISKYFLPTGVLGRRVVTVPSGSALLPPVTDRDLAPADLGTGRILQDYFDGGIPIRACSAGLSSSGSEVQSDDEVLDEEEQPEAPFAPPEEDVSSVFELLDRRFVVAKKRNMTLGDVANTWRRSVLAYSSAEQAFPLEDKRLDLWKNAGFGYTL